MKTNEETKSQTAKPLAQAHGSGARCRECGKPATCYGEYEMGGEGYACDDCCGHGNEDGWCKPFPAPPNDQALRPARTNEKDINEK